MQDRTRALRFVAPFGFLCFASGGCRGSKEDFEQWKAEQEHQEAAAAAAKPKAAAKPEYPPIELSMVEVPGLGLELNLPRGVKTLRATEQGVTYSLPLEGKPISVDVSVRAFGESSLDRAKAAATQLGGQIAEANELGGKHEIVLAPQGILQTVEVFLPDASVQCKGPKDLLPKLREICSSLQRR